MEKTVCMYEDKYASLIVIYKWYYLEQWSTSNNFYLLRQYWLGILSKYPMFLIFFWTCFFLLDNNFKGTIIANYFGSCAIFSTKYKQWSPGINFVLTCFFVSDVPGISGNDTMFEGFSFYNKYYSHWCSLYLWIIEYSTCSILNKVKWLSGQSRSAWEWCYCNILV